MIRLVSTPVVVAVVGLLASHASAQTQLLQNTSFEDGPDPITNTRVDEPDHWTLASPDFPTQTRRIEYMGSQAFEMNARTGDRYLASFNNHSASWGHAEQAVAPPNGPGVYDLALSFWARIDSTALLPSSVIGELIVDGEVVASAGHSNTDQGFHSDYKRMLATWKGFVQDEILVRITLIGDGAGAGVNEPSSWGNAAVDDVELFASDCANQHEVDSVSPNLIAAPASDTSITLTGVNLDQVTAVRLIRTGPGNNGVEIAGSNLTPGGGGTTLTVDLASEDAPTGFYDIITEQAGCNPRVITGGLQVLEPGTSPNLLVNAGFEVPQDQGNVEIWFGDYRTNPALNPTPLQIDGVRAWAESHGFPDILNTVTWQTVPVAPGSTVDFLGWFANNAISPSTSSTTVNLWDMSVPTPVLLDTLTIDQDTPPTDPGGVTGDWVEVTLSGVSNSGYVAVEFTTELNTLDWGLISSAFADAFVLTADPPCENPHRPMHSWPSAGIHTDNATITITGGSNLDLATAVDLVFVDSTEPGDQPEVIVPGTIVTQTPTSLTVDFPTATMGAAEGLYNLVVEQPSCTNPNLVFARVGRFPGAGGPSMQPNIPPTFVDKYEIVCANPTEITGIDPATILSADLLEQITIMGTNLHELDNVFLVQGPTVVPAVSLVPSGSDLIATFNFVGLPAGFYDVVGSRPDACRDPEPLLEVLRYAPPGTNLLLNGDFEIDGPQGQNVMPVRFWESVPGTGPQPKYNGSTWTPQFGDPPPRGYDGTDNRGSIDEGASSSTARAIQTVQVAPGAVLTLTGHIMGGVSVGNTHTHRVVIWDGLPDTVLIDEFTHMRATAGQFAWTAFELTGQPSGTEITIEWGHIPTPGGAGGGNVTATHVDEMVLIQEALPCNIPFADADGDGDVDQADFAVFQICMTGGVGSGGPPIPTDPAYCECFDRNGDGRIDDQDLLEFINCYTGPTVLHVDDPNPNCSQQPAQ